MLSLSVLACIFLPCFQTCALSEVVSKPSALLTMVSFSRIKPYWADLNNWRYTAHLLPLVNMLSRISPPIALVTVPAEFYLQRCAISLFNSWRTKILHLPQYFNTYVCLQFSLSIFSHNSLFQSVLSTQSHVCRKRYPDNLDISVGVYHLWDLVSVVQ